MREGDIWRRAEEVMLECIQLALLKVEFYFILNDCCLTSLVGLVVVDEAQFVIDVTGKLRLWRLLNTWRFLTRWRLLNTWRLLTRWRLFTRLLSVAFSLSRNDFHFLCDFREELLIVLHKIKVSWQAMSLEDQTK